MQIILKKDEQKTKVSFIKRLKLQCCLIGAGAVGQNKM